MKALLIFALLSFVLPALGQSRTPTEALVKFAGEQQLAQNPVWRRLLHLKTNSWGHLQSEIDGPNFLLGSPAHDPDPQLEITKYLERLFQEPADLPEAQALQCRFPARYLFLREHLANLAKDLGTRWPDRPCPRYQSWFDTLRGISVSLVFSSYYLNNPSSTFGHTFLRLNKSPASKTGERYELLDYGINYAANPTTDNPFLYAYLGMFGGFPGVFTTQPYYYKVREYNHAEARDLWQYELSIAPSGVDRMLSHVWELQNTWASYWYMTKNCSYYILTLLEVGDSHLNLTDRLKEYVIPTDTVQLVWQTPGLVKDVSFRPSSGTELFWRVRSLSPAQQREVARIARDQALPADFAGRPQSESRALLDAAMDDMDFRYPVQVQERDSAEARFKNELMSLRSQIFEPTPDLHIEPGPNQAPHLGHGSRRAGLGLLNSSLDGRAELFEYRFALHDFLDPAVGYPEYAQITSFDFKFKYFEQGHALFGDESTLFEVVSLSPYGEFSKSLSWNLRLGTEKLKDEACPDCQAGLVTGGAGYTLAWPGQAALIGYLGLKAGGFYTASGGAASVDNPEAVNFPRFLFALGPHLILKARCSAQWAALFEGWVREQTGDRISQNKQISLAAQWSASSQWGLRLTGVQRWYEQSASLQSYFYY